MSSNPIWLLAAPAAFAFLILGIVLARNFRRIFGWMFGVVIVKRERWNNKCVLAEREAHLRQNVVPKLQSERDGLIRKMSAIREALACGPCENPVSAARRLVEKFAKPKRSNTTEKP